MGDDSPRMISLLAPVLNEDLGNEDWTMHWGIGTS